MRMQAAFWMEPILEGRGPTSLASPVDTGGCSMSAHASPLLSPVGDWLSPDTGPSERPQLNGPRLPSSEHGQRSALSTPDFRFSGLPIQRRNDVSGVSSTPFQPLRPPERESLASRFTESLQAPQGDIRKSQEEFEVV